MVAPPPPAPGVWGVIVWSVTPLLSASRLISRTRLGWSSLSGIALARRKTSDTGTPPPPGRFAAACASANLSSAAVTSAPALATSARFRGLRHDPGGGRQPNVLERRDDREPRENARDGVVRIRRALDRDALGAGCRDRR